MRKSAILLLVLAMLFSPLLNAKPKKQRSSERCITAEADAIFAALSPLTKSCSRVGPASARWYVDGNIWNDMSHDQQAQLMDQVATRQAIQSAHVTIHVYVYSTDVGEIGPGWTGEWKFRRNRD